MDALIAFLENPPLSDHWLMVLGLLFLFVISFVGNIPIPLPITITVMWLGQFNFPVSVILVATVGQVVGWAFLDGPIKRWMLRRPRLQKSIPPVYHRFFLRKTGFWLFVFNALPFPFDPIRFLALLNDYDRPRFLSVLFVSRLMRNTMLVALGSALAPYRTLFWGAMIGFLLLPLAGDYLMKKLLSRIKPDESMIQKDQAEAGQAAPPAPTPTRR